MRYRKTHFEDTHCNGSRRIRPTRDPPMPLHRIATVMEQEGVTSRTLARRLGKTMKAVTAESQPTCDMLLSELFRWQSVLCVPAAELLVESADTLASPIRLRASLLKLMRTVRSIQELSKEDSIQVLAMQLSENILEMMPELKEVSAWPTVGQRRRLDELGAILDKVISTPEFRGHPENI